MTDELLQSARTVKEEAKKLQLACLEAVGTGSLLHVAFDRKILTSLPMDQAVLIGALGSVQ